MTNVNPSLQQPQASLSKRMIIGAGIGLAVISFFLFSTDHPDPTWGKYWMIRPLIIVPFAGAMGGLCNLIILQFSRRFGIHMIFAILLSVLVFLFGLWIGIILGLDGTLWD